MWKLVRLDLSLTKGKYSTNSIAPNNVSSAQATASYLGDCINSITKANVQAGDESSEK